MESVAFSVTALVTSTYGLQEIVKINYRKRRKVKFCSKMHIRKLDGELFLYKQHSTPN